MTIQSQTKTRIKTLARIIQTSLQYLSDGILRIFKATDDNYPKTGVQPFDGEVPHRKRH